jgi:RNA polymerase sigma-70 factor (ECF subfamily)
MTATRDIGDLFDRHFDDVFAYVAFRLAGDLHGASDIAQEVFIAAWRDRHRLRTPEAARAWLLGIARHKVADHFRTRPPPPEPPEVGPDRAAETDAGLSQAQGIARHRARRVAAAMAMLADHQADLLEDKYIRGLSVRAIAQQRDTSEKAVESALSRAREAFRRTYESLTRAEEAAR